MKLLVFCVIAMYAGCVIAIPKKTIGGVKPVKYRFG